MEQRNKQQVRKAQTKVLREEVRNNVAKRFRSGAIILTLFENHVAGKWGDRILYNISVQKSYKEGEDWKYANSFSQDDIIKVMTLLDLASEYIFIKTDEEANLEEENDEDGNTGF